MHFQYIFVIVIIVEHSIVWLNINIRILTKNLSLVEFIKQKAFREEGVLMRKKIALLLTMALVLTGCGSKKDSGNGKKTEVTGHVTDDVTSENSTDDTTEKIRTVYRSVRRLMPWRLCFLLRRFWVAIIMPTSMISGGMLSR